MNYEWIQIFDFKGKNIVSSTSASVWSDKDVHSNPLVLPEMFGYLRFLEHCCLFYTLRSAIGMTRLEHIDHFESEKKEDAWTGKNG